MGRRHLGGGSWPRGGPQLGRGTQVPQGLLVAGLGGVHQGGRLLEHGPRALARGRPLGRQLLGQLPRHRLGQVAAAAAAAPRLPPLLALQRVQHVVDEVVLHAVGQRARRRRRPRVLLLALPVDQLELGAHALAGQPRVVRLVVPRGQLLDQQRHLGARLLEDLVPGLHPDHAGAPGAGQRGVHRPRRRPTLQPALRRRRPHQPVLSGMQSNDGNLQVADEVPQVCVAQRPNCQLDAALNADRAVHGGVEVERQRGGHLGQVP
mmetsp:Transcript_52553/g.90409  ORF Transcript_52553/g.90409 Transcript_52553/m.90409 type:complete len:263 (-) Transcript_52553:470-1258(-)